MQINVGSLPIAHNIALRLVNENNFDILLLQEPWIFSNLSAHRFISNQIYESLSPFLKWYTRPWVFTYVRKSASIKVFQVEADLSRDVVKILIPLKTTGNLSVWNVYNALVGFNQAWGDLSTLLSSTNTLDFVGGDFNVRHPLWDLTAIHPHTYYRDVIDWYSTRDLHLLNPT